MHNFDNYSIMYVSGLYMPASGGAEISAFLLLRALSRRHLAVTVVTSDRTAKDDRFGPNEGITVLYTAQADLVKTMVGLLELNSFDCVITQGLWAELALQTARNFDVPSLYYARTPFGELDLSSTGEACPDLVVANSQAVSKYIHDRWGRKAPVVRSIVDFEEVRVRHNSSKYITMINPIVSKGGEIFRDVAEAMVEREFLAVKGWSHLRSKDGWDLAVLQELAQSYNTDPAWTPQDVALDHLSNVQLIGSTGDIGSVYARTRILLVPSLEAESAPRVILEAMCNGIPVIGSGVGGIPELLSGAGIVVENFRNLDDWLDAVRRLDDSEIYSAESEAGRRAADSIDFVSEVEKFLQALGSLGRRAEKS